ncbi:uncharacterized protein [Diadema antillarum]|uniref:uncharacterized protein n=1 Tax=Diadema antillarum TaxID=105358 RepID=UPI003A8B4E61
MAWSVINPLVFIFFCFLPFFSRAIIFNHEFLPEYNRTTVFYDDSSETSRPHIVCWTFNTSCDTRVRISLSARPSVPPTVRVYIGDGIPPVPGKDPRDYFKPLVKLRAFGSTAAATSVSNAAWVVSMNELPDQYPAAFTMLVASVSPPEPILLLPGMSHNISSPNYGETYPDNFYGLWTLQAPPNSAIAMNVLAFQTEKCCDDVFILFSSDSTSSHENIHLSGSVVTPDTIFPSVAFNTSFLSVVFTSNNKIAMGGFLLAFKAVIIHELNANKDVITTESPWLYTNVSSTTVTSRAPSTSGETFATTVTPSLPENMAMVTILTAILSVTYFTILIILVCLLLRTCRRKRARLKSNPPQLMTSRFMDDPQVYCEFSPKTTSDPDLRLLGASGYVNSCSAMMPGCKAEKEKTKNDEEAYAAIPGAETALYQEPMTAGGDTKGEPWAGSPGRDPLVSPTSIIDAMTGIPPSSPPPLPDYDFSLFGTDLNDPEANKPVPGPNTGSPIYANEQACARPKVLSMYAKKSRERHRLPGGSISEEGEGEGTLKSDSKPCP